MAGPKSKLVKVEAPEITRLRDILSALASCVVKSQKKRKNEMKRTQLHQFEKLSEFVAQCGSESADVEWLLRCIVGRAGRIRERFLSETNLVLELGGKAKRTIGVCSISSVSISLQSWLVESCGNIVSSINKSLAPGVAAYETQVYSASKRVYTPVTQERRDTEAADRAAGYQERHDQTINTINQHLNFMDD